MPIKRWYGHYKLGFSIDAIWQWPKPQPIIPPDSRIKSRGSGEFRHYK